MVLGQQEHSMEFGINKGNPGAIRTISGRVFNPLQMRPDDVNMWDIAWALHQQVRFNGHIPILWDVLSHSFLAWRIADREYKGKLTPAQQAQILLHDASEAYTGDIVRPLKRQLTGFKEAEDEIQKIIMERFGLTWDEQVEQFIKRYDNLALGAEMKWFDRLPDNAEEYALDWEPKRIKLLPYQYVSQMKELSTRLGGRDLRGLFEIPTVLEPYIGEGQEVETSVTESESVSDEPTPVTDSDFNESASREAMNRLGAMRI